MGFWALVCGLRVCNLGCLELWVQSLSVSGCGLQVLGRLSLLLWIYSPPYVDRIRLWAYDNKIPIYPIFYPLKGDCKDWVGGFHN